MRLLIGGSPCTYWSIAQTKNRETEPKGLGWELFKNYLIAIEKFKPDFFLYENNKSMNTAIREQITCELGVEPILINSALVSAQNRQRLYWTNIPGVEQPEDRGILLRDILERPVFEESCTARMSGKPLTEREMAYMVRETRDGRNHFAFDYHHDGTKEKSSCVTANTHRGVPYNVLIEPVQLTNCSPQQIEIVGPIRVCNIAGGSQGNRIYSTDAKSCAIKAQGGGLGGHGQGLYAVPIDDYEFVSGETTGTGDVEFIGGFTKKDGKKWLEDGKAFSRNFNQGKRLHGVNGKSVTVTAQGAGLAGNAGLYAVPFDCDVVVTDNSIRCQRRDKKHSTVQGSHVNFCDGKSQTLSPSHIPQILVGQNGEEYPVYKVQDGQITIRDKQYPIKLADGFYIIRKLTLTECMRLQTVPENYIFPVSNTQALKMLGNGWTCDVISHILSYCPNISSEPLTVLSMYDGMSCGRIALNKLGALIDRYFATEIDKYAIKTSQANFPDIVHLGDAFQVREDTWKLPV